jgi:hypothetical protein
VDESYGDTWHHCKGDTWHVCTDDVSGPYETWQSDDMVGTVGC